LFSARLGQIFSVAGGQVTLFSGQESVDRGLAAIRCGVGRI
jgi:hypothetical protein